MASPSLAVAKSAATDRDIVPSSQTLCSGCGEPIPAKRLAAVPHAETCVPCLESSGDVPRIKRYDEHTRDGDVVSTVFTKNKQIEAQMRRVNTMAPPDEAFDIAVGDDSHLTREPNPENDHAYNMREAFLEETAEDEQERLLDAAREHLEEHAVLSANVFPKQVTPEIR